MWLWLTAAIASEVTATMSLRASAGFKAVGPTMVVITGYGFAFFALSQALHRGMSLGVAYAVWTGIGVAAVAILGAVIFRDTVGRVQIFGIVLVIAGVAGVTLGATH